MARLLPPSGTGGRWFPRSRLALSEVMTIVILFHLSGYRCFKWYCQECVSKQLAKYFPRLVSYNRFVELMNCSALPLALYTQLFRRGKPTGIGFIDSTPLKACHNRRICQHRVFKGSAERGKSSTGWFYGFKLHLTINDRRELCAFFSAGATWTTGDPGVINRLCRDLWENSLETGDIYPKNSLNGYAGRELS
jgi:hypothetical protein